MQLSQIGTDVQGFFERIEGDAKTFLAEHVPGIAAAAQKLESSVIIQALEGTFLPPDIEQMVASMITKLAEKFPAPAPDGAEAETPAE